MSDLNAGFSASFSPDPEVNLKGKGMPWPVYLAIGLAIAALIGFFVFRAVQDRKNRKLHVAFMEEFAAYEKDDVNAFWRCLFGKEGDGRRFTVPEQFGGAMDSALAIDPKGFPDKVRDECIGKLTKASEKAKTLNAPPEYNEVLDKYGKALAGMANALASWVESAPKRYALREQDRKLGEAGGFWSGTANPRKPEPGALQYDKFLRCAAPDIDKMKDGQELLKHFASRCLHNTKEGWKVDPDFLKKLSDSCVPDAVAAAPAKAPPTFPQVLAKMSPVAEQLSGAVEKCMKEAKRFARQDDVTGLGKTWTDAFNASSEVRKIGKENLKSE